MLNKHYIHSVIDCVVNKYYTFWHLCILVLYILSINYYNFFAKIAIKITSCLVFLHWDIQRKRIIIFLPTGRSLSTETHNYAALTLLKLYLAGHITLP